MLDSVGIELSFDFEAQNSAGASTGIIIDARSRLAITFGKVLSITRIIIWLRLHPHHQSQGIEEDETLKAETRLLIPDGSTRITEVHEHGSSSTSSSAYGSSNSHDHQITLSQDSDIFPDSTHHDVGILNPDQLSSDTFVWHRKRIAEIVKNRNLNDLCRTYGGVIGVARALSTDQQSEVSTSQPVYQFLPILFRSFLEASNNYTNFLLSCAAVLSLVFGVEEDGKKHGFGWLNGTILISTILIIIVLTTVHKCWQEWSIRKLENTWHSIGKMNKVLIVRDGNCVLIGEADLRVGNLVILQKGDQVPADGLLMSSVYDQAPLEVDSYGLGKPIAVDEDHPFLFYGSRVVNGKAEMLVTSTRMDTVWGERMRLGAEENNRKSFESYIHNASNCVNISGLIISILIIIVMFLRYHAKKLDDERGYRPESKGEPTSMKTITEFINGIITRRKGTARVFMALLSVSLLGIMEGMPFVVSISTTMWCSKTLADKATERSTLACLDMASVTIICTDKFGGLSEHKEEIDNFCVGGEFVSESSAVDSRVLERLCDGIGTQFIASPRDFASTASVSWAEQNLGLKKETVIEQCKMIRYKSSQECRQVLMEKCGNAGYLHCNGCPLDILSLCSQHYEINGEFKEINEPKRRMLKEIINVMLAKEARVIAYACKSVSRDLIEEVSTNEELNDDLNDLIFIAMISLKDVEIEATKEAVSTLREGGVKTILTSGDDVSVLEHIGLNCGLIAPDSDDQLVLSGEQFRTWSEEERMEKSDKIRVMGNCLPSDKTLLVEILQRKGHVVALLAQKTVDAPSLKRADIGLAFGTWSSEAARECCDIAIWNFNCVCFIADAIRSGRCFQDSTRKFVQLHLTYTISSTLITFFSVVSMGESSVTPAQLFWMNLVVALVGGLALMTGPIVTKAIKPSGKLMTKAMWRNIVIQASYQTIVFVTLQHMGQAFLGTSGRVTSVVANGYFLCQLFGIFIAREPEKKNIFRGVFCNSLWFWLASVIFVICQAVFCTAERALGNIPVLNLKWWGACVLIGLGSWLLDLVGKLCASCFWKRIP